MTAGSECAAASTFEMTGIRGVDTCAAGHVAASTPGYVAPDDGCRAVAATRTGGAAIAAAACLHSVEYLGELADGGRHELCVERSGDRELHRHASLEVGLRLRDDGVDGLHGTLRTWRARVSDLAARRGAGLRAWLARSLR